MFSRVLTFSFPLVLASQLFAGSYLQTNVVSDQSGIAAVTDPNLKDPWGVSYSPTSPIWVSDRATGVSTLYNGLGTITPLVVTVPPGTAATGPTGQVFAGGTNFRLNGAGVNFIFDTLGGTIDAWNGSAGTTAVVMATTSGANYTGLALANNTLYAANFKAGGDVNVFNSSFAQTGSFTDPNIPSGYAPYNVQYLNGNLYVEYARVSASTPVATPGAGGYVDVFSTSGTLLRTLVSNGPLDAPWGVTIAPAAFGAFGGDLLVGNFGNGEINAFNSTTGASAGTLTDSNGNPIVNNGLWSLSFDSPNGAPGALNPNELFFTAGPNQGNDGLLGAIVAVPEPGAWSLLTIGLLAITAFAFHRRQSSHS